MRIPDRISADELARAQVLIRDEAVALTERLNNDPEDDWQYQALTMFGGCHDARYAVLAYDETGEFVGLL